MISMLNEYWFMSAIHSMYLKVFSLFDFRLVIAFLMITVKEVNLCPHRVIFFSYLPRQIFPILHNIHLPLNLRLVLRVSKESWRKESPTRP